MSNRSTFLSKNLSLRYGLPVVVAVAVLTMAPFAAALGIHHDFAAADHDGHQHSDFDLCQWVQQHVSNSFALQPVLVAEPCRPCLTTASPYAHNLLSNPSVSLAAPRGPPLS